MLIYKIGGVALNGTDNIIISAFDGLISVGVLSNYSIIVGGIQALITKITGGLTGSIGNYIAKESKDKEKVLYKIIRGGSADLQNPAGSRKGYAEGSINETWGFRYILYKN